MKKVIVVFAFLVVGAPAWGVSMCMLPGSGTTYNQPSANENNNRGYWIVGNSVFGESHCSAVGLITADTIANFETMGKYCWCRVTQMAAPNGYVARRSGAWVLQPNSNSAPLCTASCASFCANFVGSWVGFRRALFAFPGS